MPELPDGAARRCTSQPGPRARPGAGQHADPARRGRSARRQPVAARAADPQRQPDRRHDARLRGDQALGRRGPARRHDRRRASRGSAGQSLRRVPAPRHHAAAGRATPTTTWARACPAGGSSSARTRTATVRRRGARSSRATSIGYGATSGEIFLRGVVGERFCVRNSGRDRGRRGHRRSRLRVHDRRHRWWSSARIGRNFAAGMSGGIAYLLDPDAAPGEHRDGRPGAARRRRRASCCATLVERHHAETGSAVAARLLADWDAALPPVRARSCRRTTSGCWTPPAGRARGPRRRRGRHGRGARVRGASWLIPRVS